MLAPRLKVLVPENMTIVSRNFGHQQPTSDSDAVKFWLIKSRSLIVCLDHILYPVSHIRLIQQLAVAQPKYLHMASHLINGGNDITYRSVS